VILGRICAWVSKISHTVSVDLPRFWEAPAAPLSCSSLMLAQNRGDVSWIQSPFYKYLVLALPSDMASASGSPVSAAVVILI
jgi:hypothetical protein